MTIDFYLDYACPYCYIAKINLDKAIQTIDYDNEIKVFYKTYELNEKAPKTTDLSSYEILAKKFNTTINQTKEKINTIKDKALSLGIDMNYDYVKMTSTFDAHRLTLYAQSVGKEKAVSKALFKAYFKDGENISDYDTLLSIATESGLDRDDVSKILNSNTYYHEIQSQRVAAQKQNIIGVPLVIINKTITLEGAKSVKDYLNAIREAKNINKPEFSSGTTCEDENCDYS